MTPAAATRTTLAVDGRDRTVDLVLPDGHPTALAVVLHGSHQTGASFRELSGGTFDGLAGRGALVAYPDAVEGLWNDARASTPSAARDLGVDDVAFVRGLAAHLAAARGVPDRVVAVGYSNGGQLVLRLLHEAGDLLAGAAVVAATMPTPDNVVAGMLEGDGRTAVPVVLVHGTDDALSPYDGGVASLWGQRPRGGVTSAPDTARYLAARNGFAGEPVTEELAWAASGRTSVRRTTFDDGTHPAVVLHTVVGGGHTVPNPDHAAFPVLGRTNRGLDTGTAVADLLGL